MKYALASISLAGLLLAASAATIPAAAATGDKHIRHHAVRHGQHLTYHHYRHHYYPRVGYGYQQYPFYGSNDPYSSYYDDGFGEGDAGGLLFGSGFGGGYGYNHRFGASPFYLPYGRHHWNH